MSELINQPEQRLKQLLDFCRRLIAGENGNELYQHYRPITDRVTATEAMEVLDLLLREGMPVATLKAWVPKILNVFHRSLKAGEWEKPGEGHFLYYLMQENRKAEALMQKIKGWSRQVFPDLQATHLKSLKNSLHELRAYESHYIKKENILFPYLEQAFPGHRCLSVMWSFHDDFRNSLKVLDELLSRDKPDARLLSRELGRLFFVVLPLIFREEQIVFPVALRAIPERLWQEMLNQSAEVGWCYIPEPDLQAGAAERPTPASSLPQAGRALSKVIDLETGVLLPEQIKWLLNTLPVDVTFIDENDEVRYFSGGEHRIFHRAKAIIGRKVQNCHPPESVHMVEEIVNAFKNGSRDHADFWISMKERFIHIRYFAVRDEEKQYKGTLEVSQDVTEIRALEGQRRLLEWE